MLKTVEAIYIHVTQRNCRTVWARFRKFYQWQMETGVYKIQGTQMIANENVFKGLFTPENAEKVLEKFKELGIK